MKKFTILFTIIFSVILFSCHDKAPTSPTTNNNTYKTTSYMPATNGSWWRYKDDKGGLSFFNCTGEKIISGFKYGIMISDNGDTMYVRIDNNLIAMINFFDFSYHENIVYNPSSTSGISQNDYTDENGKKVRYVYTVIDKNMNMTLNNKNYSKVLKIELQAYYFDDSSANYVNSFSTYFYFAMGVGIIKFEIPYLGNFELEDYKIM